MSRSDGLGIVRLDAIHFYVRDLAESRRLYVEQLGFAEVAALRPDWAERAGQVSVVFEGGGCRIICSSPIDSRGPAARFLRKHPDGVGSIFVEVEDAERAFHLLDERGGTPVRELRTHEDAQGAFRSFAITTPLGDTTLRFVERRGSCSLYPGFERRTVSQAAGGLGAVNFDHVTINHATMAPSLLWMQYVLGFERFWDIAFHTDELHGGHATGSGLRSVVMWDPASGIKLANNEPFRPHFAASQIHQFCEEHGSNGVQHIALGVTDIVRTVQQLKDAGVSFMPTPSSYYDGLPARLSASGVKELAEPIDELGELGILVDGVGQNGYLLQVFMRPFADLFGRKNAGPFFFELIERKGDSGFGAGNFRALFESIEREQQPLASP